MFKSKIIAIFMAMIACQSVFANNEQNQQIAEKIAYGMAMGTVFHGVLSSQYEKERSSFNPQSSRVMECMILNTNDVTYTQFLLPKVEEFTRDKSNVEIEKYLSILNEEKLLSWFRNLMLSRANLEQHSTEHYDEQINREYSEDQFLIFEDIMMFGRTQVPIHTAQQAYNLGAMIGTEDGNQYMQYILNECGVNVDKYSVVKFNKKTLTSS